MAASPPLATADSGNVGGVARTLRLASLAPSIVGMIVEGNEPDGLSLRRLMKGFPIRWDEQQLELCGGMVPVDTAYYSAQMVTEIMNCGALVCLPKPVKVGLLLLVLEAALRGGDNEQTHVALLAAESPLSIGD